jgi:hypothetical protein
MKLHEGQRVTLTAAEGWDWLSVRRGGTGSINLLATGPLEGTVTDVGGTLAQVTLDRGETVLVDRKHDPRVTLANSITLDLSTWTRLAEVEQYAARAEVTLATAIKNLVNVGLSHR